jgi:enamine deaminase RidA (YjgF/YER057c/UK114 family)
MSQTLQRSMLTPQMAQAARNLAALGSGRDNMLAHINPREAAMLMQMGGKGDMNPRTGLPQFDDGGGGGGQDAPPPPQDPAGGTATQPAALTPTGQFPAGQTFASLNAAIPDSGGLPNLWEDPNNPTEWFSPTGALPQIDPTQMAALDTWYQNIQPVGEWNPWETSFAGGGFVPTPGNPLFETDPANSADVVLSPQGDAIAQQQYGAEQRASVIQQRNNNAGGFLPFEIALAPLALAGGLAGAGALGLADAAGAGAADLTGDALATSIAEDLPAAGVEGGGAAAAAGTAATDLGITGSVAGAADALDPFAGSTLPEIAAATPSDAASATAAAADASGLADPFAGSSLGDATSSLASLGANPSLGELAAATPDDLIGDASANATTLAANAADTATFDDGTTALTSAASDAAGPSTSLETADLSQFPGGFILPPDPATGLVTGTGATAAGSGGGIGGWLSSLASKGAADLSDPFKLLGLGASGIGLISSLSGQNKNVGNVSGNLTQQQALANQTNATGTQLQNYLTSGTLPPGLMTQVQLATQDSIQNIKSKYAANGMGPNSTPEQQDINRVLQNQASTIAAIGQQLFNSGTADLQIDQSVLNSMLTANTSLNNQTNQAIANLARALSGAGSTTTTTTKTT